MSQPPDLDEEMDRLLERLPDGAARAMRKVRAPEAARYRIPAGVALTVGGVLGFMPILGFGWCRLASPSWRRTCR